MNIKLRLNKNIYKHLLVNITIIGCLLLNSETFAQMLIDPQDPPQQLRDSATGDIAEKGKYIVLFTPSTSRQQRADIARAAGANVRFNYKIISAVAIKVNNDNVLNALQNRPEVIEIVPDGNLTIDAPKPPPTAPTALNVTGTTSNSVSLAWVDNSDEDGFSIERCTGSGCTSFAEVGTTSANTTLFTDTSAGPGISYRFQVRAYRTGGSPGSRLSNPSTPVGVTTDMTSPGSPPAAATGLSATEITYNSVRFVWNKESCALNI